MLVEAGHTRVLCNVSIDDTVPDWRKESGGGWLTAEYGMLPRSTQCLARARRPDAPRHLRAAVDVDKLGPRTLIVDCDVLQADGGTRTASITGGYVALALALRQLIQAGLVPPGILVTPVAAVSAGVVNEELLLDLCYEEDSAAAVDLNVVMTGAGQFVEVQGTAEGAPFDHDTLLGLVNLARQGIEQLLAAQAAILSASR